MREELEDFLKDDDDISKMCLTRKAELSKDGVGELLSICLCSLSLKPAPASFQHASLISTPNIRASSSHQIDTRINQTCEAFALKPHLLLPARSDGQQHRPVTAAVADGRADGLRQQPHRPAAAALRVVR